MTITDASPLSPSWSLHRLRSNPRTRLSSHRDAFDYAVPTLMMASNHRHQLSTCLIDHARHGDQAWFPLQRGFRPQGTHTPHTIFALRHSQPCTMAPITTTTPMAHLVDGEPANFEVHFLHADHPRDGFCVMGVDPLVYYEFRTPIGFLSTHTIVRREILPPSLSPLLSRLRIQPFSLQRATDG